MEKNSDIEYVRSRRIHRLRVMGHDETASWFESGNEKELKNHTDIMKTGDSQDDQVTYVGLLPTKTPRCSSCYLAAEATSTQTPSSANNEMRMGSTSALGAPAADVEGCPTWKQRVMSIPYYECTQSEELKGTSPDMPKGTQLYDVNEDSSLD
ncbi:hypothetical protein EVAR_13538_1 [Eumeta japonica]|uniref:Uncharacterized protein n=1 Tax=Eumeta variegata TaxID=151549 RepID=A0A4C1U8Y4_EUMVA|nr:hypothetical protein EVAR_13538_1 [Eumeta japonica]